MMARAERDSTTLHESAHAAISHLVGEMIQYLELQDDRNGVSMPLHSPCPLCGSEVPESRACPTCFDYYLRNEPETDSNSRRIERRYRIEAAVAAAGEIAEEKFGNGTPLASDDELAGDRERVRNRSSLRHLWLNQCSGYRMATDCIECAAAAEQLRQSVRAILDRPLVWSATNVLAQELAHRGRIGGSEVRDILEQAGIAFGSEDIDAVWPPAEETAV
jgi:hypothetical protein